jgi:hypothetical protein
MRGSDAVRAAPMARALAPAPATRRRRDAARQPLILGVTCSGQVRWEVLTEGWVGQRDDIDPRDLARMPATGSLTSSHFSASAHRANPTTG